MDSQSRLNPRVKIMSLRRYHKKTDRPGKIVDAYQCLYVLQSPVNKTGQQFRAYREINTCAVAAMA